MCVTIGIKGTGAHLLSPSWETVLQPAVLRSVLSTITTIRMHPRHSITSAEPLIYLLYRLIVRDRFAASREIESRESRSSPARMTVLSPTTSSFLPFSLAERFSRKTYSRYHENNHRRGGSRWHLPEMAVSRRHTTNAKSRIRRRRQRWRVCQQRWQWRRRRRWLRQRRRQRRRRRRR